jgi:hypothetical protein
MAEKSLLFGSGLLDSPADDEDNAIEVHIIKIFHTQKGKWTPWFIFSLSIVS